MATERGFIPRLESLRGVAAVLVGFYHCCVMFLPPSGASRILFGPGNGMGCVVVFFIISGFVLARSLDRSAAPSWLAFVIGRVFRLLPASAVVVGLLTALHQRYGFYVGFETSFDPVNVLLNMLLLKSDVNGVMWSLTVELAATPLIFAAVLAYRRFGRAPLVAVAVLLFGLSFVGQYRDAIGANLAPLYAFVIGILIHFEGKAFASRVPDRLVPAVAMAGLSIFFIAGLLKQTGVLTILLDTIAGAMLVTAITRWPRLGILKPLDWSVVRFFGRVSYSFYLFHPLSIAPAFRLLGTIPDQLSPAGNALALSAATVLLTAVPAYLCHRFVELPGINLGRALAGRIIGNGHQGEAADVPLAGPKKLPDGILIRGD